jgi:SAM-dependent methyltransferase
MPGQSLLQTPGELDARNVSLTHSLSAIVREHLVRDTGRALDVGCQAGNLMAMMGAAGDLEWTGIDPRFDDPETSPAGHELLPGYAHDLPFAAGTFDLVLLANVYEHIDPELRDESLDEIRRVLAPRGILVGQLPNPHFPVESHSRLPFMGYLPAPLRKRYWRLTPVHWQMDFHAVTVRDLRRRALTAGFTPELVERFNYPPEAIPARVRPIARAISPMYRVVPWAWQFCFRRSG